MNWYIDNNKPVYIQLVEQLKSKIISGEFKAGDKIDSVRSLAEDAQVNPNTMQKALVELETDNEEMIKSMKEELAVEQIKNLKINLERLGLSEEEIINLVISNIKGEK